MSSAIKTFLRPVAKTALRSNLPLSTSTRLTFARSFHSTIPKMAIITVSKVEEYDEIISKNPFVVVDWFATWCGPCKMIAPMLKKWSDEMPDVVFVKVDVDELPELAQKSNIKAMPTFHLFRDGEKVDEFVSAVPPKLLALIEKHRPAVEEKPAEETS